MRISKLLLICLCCLLAVPALWGQAANSQAHQGVLGYLDPQTGAFRPIAPPAEDTVEPPATSTFTGTITVTITVTIKTAGITSVNCSIGTSVQDTGALHFYSESASVAGTGSPTKKCVATINYAWLLTTGNSDVMSTIYSVIGTGTGGTRSSTLSTLDSRKVPSTGTTTSLTASVTL
jgi:hypothetical protein